MKISELKSQEIDIYKDSIIDLLHQSFMQSFPGISIKLKELYERLEKLKDYLLTDNTKFFCVIEQENIIGFIWFFIKNNETIHVNHFSIDKNYRRKGIGKSLIKSVECFAYENQINEIELFVTTSNEDAIMFYKNNDFETERLIMKKRLI